MQRLTHLGNEQDRKDLPRFQGRGDLPLPREIQEQPAGDVLDAEASRDYGDHGRWIW